MRLLAMSGPNASLDKPNVNAITLRVEVRRPMTGKTVIGVHTYSITEEGVLSTYR
jgi:hypothetical protein